MRIFSSIIWVSTALLLNVVAANAPPHNEVANFTFSGDYFKGLVINGIQSSVFDLDELKKEGKIFAWTQTSGQVEILQVNLMNNNSHAIASWCPPDEDCTRNEGFSVSLRDDKIGGEIALSSTGVDALNDFTEAVLYFRLDWRFNAESPDGGRNSSWSQEWAVARGQEAMGRVYAEYASWMTAGGSPVSTPGPAPTTTTSAVVSGTAASGSATQTSAQENSGSKSRRLSTGAVVGIVVGCVGGLILVSVVAGCLCFRRRRNAGVERGGSRGVQDIIAEKEARASILDKDQPDTPYSEQTSQHPLHRGLGLAGRNESGVDLGIGQAISGDGRGSVHTESLHTVVGANDRNSALYSSLGGAANSAHGTPVMGSGAFASGNSIPPTQTHTPTMSAHDRSSAMGSPVPRASSQLDRSLSPYRDSAGQHDYGQHQHHHHVVDGADPVQQEHSNDGAARSPSSLYSTDPLDELQPISPESAHDNGGAAGGSGGGGGRASSQPPGHGRSTTPSGVSGQYAHLVEDGMTEDEIRRMEEEERALDEAIEQDRTAGRKR